MNFIKAFGLIHDQMHHIRCHYFETCYFKPADNFADQVLLNAIRLDNRERLLNGHTFLPF